MRVAILSAVIVVAVLVWLLPRPEPAETALEPEVPRVATVHPTRGTAVRSITLPGDLIGRNEAALYAKVTGYLKDITVDKGDAVKRGQLLATIEVPELEQKLKRARADLQVRRITYERLNGVWKTDQRLVAREDVDVARGQFDQAQADVEELETLIGYTRIVAPFDGTIVARYVDPGALIEANGHGAGADGGGSHGSGAAPVVAIADTDALRVYVYVPEQETSAIHRGQPAALKLREFPGREFHGTVARFNGALDLSTRTMLTEVDLENPKHELYPGMYADVVLELEHHDQALQVPATAVNRVGDQASVFVVRDGKLARVPVETGIVSSDAVEVTAGLRGDEAVVQRLGPGLQEGEQVEAVEPAPQTALAAP